MTQVRKPEVEQRILTAALNQFAHEGYPGTTMAQVAARAELATGNLYRYFSSKKALFEAVIPTDLAERHDRLLDERIEALSSPASEATARDLLEFWIANRLAVAFLLGRAEGSPLADYPAAFVERLVSHAQATLGADLAAGERLVLQIVFDNTRRAIAQLLLTAQDGEELADLVRTFWSYQLAGLAGLMDHLGSAS